MFRALYEVGGLRALGDECSRILGCEPVRKPARKPPRPRHHATPRPAKLHAETLRRNRTALLNTMLAEAFDARRTRIEPVEAAVEPALAPAPAAGTVDADAARARRQAISEARAVVEAGQAERARLWSMVREGVEG